MKESQHQKANKVGMPQDKAHKAEHLSTTTVSTTTNAMVRTIGVDTSIGLLTLPNTPLEHCMQTEYILRFPEDEELRSDLRGEEYCDPDDEQYRTHFYGPNHISQTWFTRFKTHLDQVNEWIKDMEQAHPQLRDAIDRVFREWRSEQKLFLDKAQQTLRHETITQYDQLNRLDRHELFDLYGGDEGEEGENPSCWRAMTSSIRLSFSIYNSTGEFQPCLFNFAFFLSLPRDVRIHIIVKNLILNAGFALDENSYSPNQPTKWLQAYCQGAKNMWNGSQSS